jgi:alkylhydroperoxidase family enzyme
MKKPERLHRYVPDELSPEQRRLYDAITQGPRAQGPQAFALTDAAGRLEGPFNALLLSPDVGTALQELGSTIRYRTALSHRAREIAILELAAIRRADFEWFAHERVGRAAGLTEDELTAIRRRKKAPSFDGTETLVRKLVRTLLRERDLDRALFDAAQNTLGERALMDLLTLVGYYDSVALSLRVWRTPLPEGEPSPFRKRSARKDPSTKDNEPWSEGPSGAEPP